MPHKNCIKSGESCVSDPASCVGAQVRSQIVDVLERWNFSFERERDTLPYECYLLVKPSIPNRLTGLKPCVECSHLCRSDERRNATYAEDKKWTELCRIFCRETKVWCTMADEPSMQNVGKSGQKVKPEHDSGMTNFKWFIVLLVICCCCSPIRIYVPQNQPVGNYHSGRFN